MDEGAEIFTYNVTEPVYAMHWSARPQKDFRLALGSFKHDKDNFIEVVELNESTGNFHFEPRLWTQIGYPATKVMFAPNASAVDLLATTSDVLRLWKISTDAGLIEEAPFISSCNSAPLTSFDWRDPLYIGTCSIDRSCMIWNVERQMMEKQLTVHKDEVNDLAWSGMHHHFATVSADGSVRISDMREIMNPSIVYEDRAASFVRVAWNQQDERYLAALAKDSRHVLILDTRYPSLPVAELEKHKGLVNAIAWAPHSSCHICTAGDDGQALIWDLKAITRPSERNLDPILSYTASAEIIQMQWSAGRPDWIAICFDNMAQILRV